LEQLLPRARADIDFIRCEYRVETRIERALFHAAENEEAAVRLCVDHFRGQLWSWLKEGKHR
jgi:hypothetical protein